ncbi:MAG: hypothetical protein BJ554DRAFT_2196 [Olpidium bornovanus]|uniref:Uncharacterized protein n=1 Tax=Olpidium bornovanus TaxID=278681 RepID=A0A8H8DGH8_9FUNG|nr:MAG: hypothetical protein BJ554DRAFT_2196 [Olpidium bornovanus]
MWLPEYDQLKDVCCSGTNSDAGAESDAGDDVVVVSRGPRKDANDEPGLDKGLLGREAAVDAATVDNTSDGGLGTSIDRQAASTDSKLKLQQEDEEGRVEALAV